MHSDAVDYPKTGQPPKQPDKELMATQFPDYMEQYSMDRKYESQTVIGVMFRRVKQILQDMQSSNTLRNHFVQMTLDKEIIRANWETYIKESLRTVKQYHFEIKNLLDLFEVENEFELISGNISNFDRWEKKSSLETNQLQNRILDNVRHMKKKYNALFYKNMDENDTDAILQKATCWYICSYFN